MVPEHDGGVGDKLSVQFPGAVPGPPILQVCNEIAFPPEVLEVCWIVREEISILPMLLKLRKVSQKISQVNTKFRHVRRFDTASNPFATGVTADASAPATTPQLPEATVEEEGPKVEELIEASEKAALVMDKSENGRITISNSIVLFTLTV